jgi:hypothetical protein
MAKSSRLQTLMIPPLVLVTVALLQDLAAFKVREHVAGLYLRVAIIVALQGVGFAIAADWISPWLQRLYNRFRRDSKREGGHLGMWLFYTLAYGALYYAYLISEQRGVAGLLPRAWR